MGDGKAYLGIGMPEHRAFVVDKKSGTV